MAHGNEVCGDGQSLPNKETLGNFKVHVVILRWLDAAFQQSPIVWFRVGGCELCSRTRDFCAVAKAKLAVDGP